MNSKWSYSPETAKLGYDLCDLDLWPMTLTFCMDITSVLGNKSWKFRDDTMTGTVKKVWQTDRQANRQTDRRTERGVRRAAWSQLKKPVGPNEIPPNIFQIRASSIAPFRTNMISKSINLSIYPSDFKEADLSHLSKKEDNLNKFSPN